MTAVTDRLGPAQLRSVMCGYRDALRGHQERLNRLNVYPVPDGDTGTNMALTLESVVAEMGSASDMADVCKAISHGSLMGARGNSGVILSQILRGLTNRLKTEDGADAVAVAEALSAAASAAYDAVMKPVEGTILTVAREAAEAAQRAAKEPEATLPGVLDAACGAACEALERTPQLLPVLAEAGVVDAGGAGFVLLLDVLLNVTDGRSVPEATDSGVSAGRPAAVVAAAVEPHAGDGDLRYEVMFLLEGADERVGAFKEAWAGIGDSIVVVGGDGLWNCHIHTNDIGAAIEAGIDAGRPRNIRVTDLAEQVEEERWVREGVGAAAAAPAPAAPVDAPVETRCAVVAVGSGEGAVEILRSLGATKIVAGGQSMNPSTGELLEAIDASPSAEVVLLPNNKNVVPVAEHAAELAGKPARLVPTTSLAEGFAALMGFDADAGAEDNARTMAKAAEDVSWGEVTWAVRDATTPAGEIHEGDFLGLLGHDIVAIGADLGGTACSLLERLVAEGHELVTVVEGKAATGEATEAVKAWLGEHRPQVAVEVVRGDQPLTAYLFSSE